MTDNIVRMQQRGSVATVGASPARGAYTVRKASELAGHWGVCFAIYGCPGSGKSTLAAQAADTVHGSPVGILDAEGGARAYANRDDITHIELHDWKAVNAVLDDLESGKLTPVTGEAKFGTIIVDNMSEVNALCMYDCLRTVPRNVGDNDRPDQKDWNTTTNRMLLLIRRFRDFAQRSGTNVIFIAWDRSQDDKVTGMPKKDVAFNPALSNQFPGMLDMVAYLTIDKKGVRKLTFEASQTTAAKFRRTPGEAAMTIPGEFVYEFSNQAKPMADILNTLKGGKAFPAERYKTQGGSTQSTVAVRAAAIPTTGQGQPADSVRGAIIGAQE